MITYQQSHKTVSSIFQETYAVPFALPDDLIRRANIPSLFQIIWHSIEYTGSKQLHSLLYTPLKAAIIHDRIRFNGISPSHSFIRVVHRCRIKILLQRFIQLWRSPFVPYRIQLPLDFFNLPSVVPPPLSLCLVNCTRLSSFAPLCLSLIDDQCLQIRTLFCLGLDLADDG